MFTISSRLSLHTENGDVVEVRTSRTFYRVVISDSEARILGPGVDQTYTIGDEIAEHLSSEGAAAVAVTLFEEGE